MATVFSPFAFSATFFYAHESVSRPGKTIAHHADASALPPGIDLLEADTPQLDQLGRSHGMRLTQISAADLDEDTAYPLAALTTPVLY